RAVRLGGVAARFERGGEGADTATVVAEADGPAAVVADETVRVAVVAAPSDVGGAHGRAPVLGAAALDAAGCGGHQMLSRVGWKWTSGISVCPGIGSGGGSGRDTGRGRRAGVAPRRRAHTGPRPVGDGRRSGRPHAKQWDIRRPPLPAPPRASGCRSRRTRRARPAAAARRSRPEGTASSSCPGTGSPAG